MLSLVITELCTAMSSSSSSSLKRDGKKQNSRIDDAVSN